MVTDFPIQAILDHLVERIVEVLPIDAAGVTLIAPGHDPHYVAASNPSALRYEQIQSELGEGPCTAAYLINAESRADLVASAEVAHHLALHDPLTGLANRTLLVEQLEHAIRRSRRTRALVALMYIDLDTFKTTNDTYGHHIGDEVLITVAHRLTALLRPGDTVARLGGDEFAVLCEDVTDASHLGRSPRRQSASSKRPIPPCTRRSGAAAVVTQCSTPTIADARPIEQPSNATSIGPSARSDAHHRVGWVRCCDMPSLPGHSPGAPFMGDTRLRGIRQLTPAECDLVGFAGPLALSRREYRFFVGPWRPSKYYVVSHRANGEVLVCSRRELERLGVAPQR